MSDTLSYQQGRICLRALITMSSIIDVHQLSWHINNKIILDDISFSIDKGKFVGVIGVNGSGKTSLLRSLYRVITPSAGNVSLNGCDIWQQSAVDVAKQVAVVSQSNAPMPYQVKDVVAMGLIPHKKLFENTKASDHALIHSAIEQLDLTDLQNNDFETLSGGEQQRVLIARAIVQLGYQNSLANQLLIMDEPTNHLDIHYQIDLLKRVQQLGCSVIVSLHDLNMASACCDEIILVNNGKVVIQGSPQEVLTPARISEIYQVNVDVIEHPQHKRPHLLFSEYSNHD